MTASTTSFSINASAEPGTTPAGGTRGEKRLRRASIRRLIRAEWVKLRSVRGTWLLAGGTILSTTVFSALSLSGSIADWQQGLPPGWNATGSTLRGTIIGQVIVAMLGASAMSSEYRTGTISTTLTIAPQRGRVLLAKTTVTGLTVLATAAVSVALSFGAGQAILAGAGLPTALPIGAGAIRALASSVGYLLCSGILGLSFATMSRSSTGALAIMVAISLVAPSSLSALPGRLGEFLAKYWPISAGMDSFAPIRDTPLPPVLGIGIMAGFTLCSALASHITLRVRDI
ncbi:MAG: ABC transporter permease [Acidipropionibacterium sp.]|jgi:hypothetical protein|nr:ABC transporter permease [Acidipropionibacterium sp.]